MVVRFRVLMAVKMTKLPFCTLTPKGHVPPKRRCILVPSRRHNPEEQHCPDAWRLCLKMAIKEHNTEDVNVQPTVPLRSKHAP